MTDECNPCVRPSGSLSVCLSAFLSCSFAYCVSHRSPGQLEARARIILCSFVGRPKWHRTFILCSVRFYYTCAGESRRTFGFLELSPFLRKLREPNFSPHLLFCLHHSILSPANIGPAILPFATLHLAHIIRIVDDLQDPTTIASRLIPDQSHRGYASNSINYTRQ